jgi:hypothetical protein
MDFNRDKVDEMTLALLYLVTFEREEERGAWAWKGFDWETLDRLHEKGLISNPKSKAKSLFITEAGFKAAEALFWQHFAPQEG